MRPARMSRPQPASLLDTAAIRRNHDRASATYDEHGVLAARLREAMLARLDWIAFVPDVVLDLGCGTGRGAEALAARWPEARVIGLDAAPGMLAVARQRPVAARLEWLQADAEVIPLPDATVDVVFSNLLLPFCGDIDAVFAEVARILKPRGLFSFTTFGPDTLAELRAAWRAADPADRHVHPFTDMHDLGDGLVRAGFAEPVLDVSRYTLTYPDVTALMRDLKAIGSQNAGIGRPRGLTGRSRMNSVSDAYEPFRNGGVLPANYEAIFGHAWGALDRGGHAGQGGEFSFPVSDIGHRGVRSR
jgi:malonyl-CoA O-methyltransferase